MYPDNRGLATETVTARYQHWMLIAAIGVAAVWHVANDIPGIAGHWQQYRSSSAAVWSVACWAVYDVVGMAAAVSVLRRGRADVATLFVALGALLACSAVVTAACGRTALFSSGNWAWGSFGWFALVLLWRRPLAWYVAAQAANGAVVLAAMTATEHIDHVDIARWGTVVYGTSAVQLVLAAGGRFLEREAARAADAAEASARTVRARAAAEAVHLDRQRRYATVRQAAAAVLAGLAQGRLLPSAVDTQQRCAVQAARLRRLIAEHDDVPDPLLHELRAIAEVAARRGIAVDLVSVGTMPTVPVPARRALLDLPLQALAVATERARVTVAGTDRSVAIAVVVLEEHPRGTVSAAVSTNGQHEDVIAQASRDGDRLWVQSVWQAASESPSSTTIR